MFSKGDSPAVDKLAFNADKSQNTKYNIDSEKKLIFYLNKILPPQPKQLNEAKGIITADYQSYLEKEWIQELRNKYKVVINYDVLKLVK